MDEFDALKEHEKGWFEGYLFGIGAAAACVGLFVLNIHMRNYRIVKPVVHKVTGEAAFKCLTGRVIRVTKS